MNNFRYTRGHQGERLERSLGYVLCEHVRRREVVHVDVGVPSINIHLEDAVVNPLQDSLRANVRLVQSVLRVSVLNQDVRAGVESLKYERLHLAVMSG